MRRVFIGLLLLSAGIAHGAAPPLAANEEVVTTLDVCGIVIRKDVPGIEHIRKAWAEVAWGGACVGGLAMGEGVLRPRKAYGEAYLEEGRGWAWYGRPFGWGKTRWSNGATSHGFSWDHTYVFYDTLDPTQARWSEVTGYGSHIGIGDMLRPASATHVGTAHPAGITIWRNSKSEFLKCPNPKASKGCEALWVEQAGPVIERIKAFLAESEPKARARQQEAEALAAQWQKQVGPEMAALAAANAARLNELATRATEQHEGCLTRERAAYAEWSKKPRKDSTAQAAERTERLANTLKQLWSGECASHPDAARGLKNAEESFQSARQMWQTHEQGEQYRAERAEKRRETLGAIVDAVTTYQTTKSALEQQQAAEAQAQADARARAQAQQASARSAQVQPSAAQSANQKQVASGQPSAEPWKSPEDLRREAAREQALRERDQQFEASAARTAAVPHCIQLASTTSYGGFKNTCGFKVDFVYCTIGSTGEGLSNFSDGCDCRGRLLCSGVIKPHSESAGLTSGAKQVVWGACKEPYTALQRGFNGREILYECKK